MRLYRDHDIEIARRVRELTDDGYVFAAIERTLSLERRIRTLIAHVRVLEDQNLRLSNRLTRSA
jgi:DNA-binding transcriptional MerR regulator